MNETTPHWGIDLSLYDTATWLCWIALALGAAWFRRWRGLILGGLAITASIFLLHLRWRMEAIELHHAGRPDDPHVDLFFVIAVTLQAVAVNVVLLPASCLGLFLASLRKMAGGSLGRKSPVPPPIPPQSDRR